MDKVWVFDMPHALRFTEARQVFLRRFLPDLIERLGLESALDVGCGVGYFSSFLRDMGLRVTALDGRRENVEEAKKRFPDIQFHHLNIEESTVRQLGSFDLVLCFGLLYHLENPFAAVRNLHALTNKVMLIESMCIPADGAVLSLRDEGQSQDQGVRFVAFYPSENCLIKMCYKVGFPFVYRFDELPQHEDFRRTFSRRRARTMLTASQVHLDFPFLSLVAEPSSAADPWATPWARIGYHFQLIHNFIQKPWREKLATVRRRLRVAR